MAILKWIMTFLVPGSWQSVLAKDDFVVVVVVFSPATHVCSESVRS